MTICSALRAVAIALLRPRLTPAAASPPVARRVDGARHDDRPPQVSLATIIPHPPRLPSRPPNRYRASPCIAGSPKRDSLIRGSCSSSRNFASGFLPTGPRDPAVAFGSQFPLSGSVEDLHLHATKHAGHTTPQACRRTTGLGGYGGWDGKTSWPETEGDDYLCIE